MSEYDDKIIIRYYNDTIDKLGLWDSELLVFKKYIKPSDRILDLGSGQGRTVFGLYSNGYVNISGLDISKNMIEIAKEKTKEKNINIPFYCASASDIPLESETFDCVFFSFSGLMTINKEEEREKVLKEVHRVLKKNGLFIFTTYDREKNIKYKKYWEQEKEKWDINRQDVRLEKFGDRICDDCPKGIFIHVPIYEEVLKLCNDNGFEIIWHELRSNICTERKEVIDNTDDCVFYVAVKRG